MKNIYEKIGKITRIYLKEDGTFTVVDTNMVKKIEKINWSISINEWGLYVHGRNEKRNWVYLHRFLMDAKDNEIIDHKNRNRLDNTIANLRVCDTRTNSYNRGLGINNTTGVTGVIYSKRDDLYTAVIKENYKRKILGYSKIFEEAARLRLKYEKDVFGYDLAPQRHLFEEFGIK